MTKNPILILVIFCKRRAIISQNAHLVKYTGFGEDTWIAYKSCLNASRLSMFRGIHQSVLIMTITVVLSEYTHNLILVYATVDDYFKYTFLYIPSVHILYVLALLKIAETTISKTILFNYVGSEMHNRSMHFWLDVYYFILLKFGFFLLTLTPIFPFLLTNVGPS